MFLLPYLHNCLYVLVLSSYYVFIVCKTDTFLKRPFTSSVTNYSYVYNSGKVSSNTEGSRTLTYLALVGTLSSRNKSTSDGSWTKNRRCIQIYDLNFRNFFRIEDETPWTISPIKIYKCMLWCVISSRTLVYVQRQNPTVVM